MCADFKFCVTMLAIRVDVPECQYFSGTCKGLYHALSLVQVEYNPIVLKSILICVCVLCSDAESHCNMTAHISLLALMNVDNSLRNVGNLIAYLIM